MSDSRGGCQLAAVPCSSPAIPAGAHTGQAQARTVGQPRVLVWAPQSGGRLIHGRHRTPGLTGLVQPVPVAGCTSGLAERNESGAVRTALLGATCLLAGPGVPLREAPGGSYFPARRGRHQPRYPALRDQPMGPCPRRPRHGHIHRLTCPATAPELQRCCTTGPAGLTGAANEPGGRPSFMIWVPGVVHLILRYPDHERRGSAPATQTLTPHRWCSRRPAGPA
jgi:hypothetical protein